MNDLVKIHNAKTVFIATLQGNDILIQLEYSGDFEAKSPIARLELSDAQLQEFKRIQKIFSEFLDKELNGIPA